MRRSVDLSMRCTIMIAPAFACACGGGANSVLVDVKTDLVAGVEFARVETVLVPEGASAGLSVDRRSDHGEDYIAGQRVAEYDGVPGGGATVTVRLRDREDRLVAERTTRFQVRGRVGLVVIISRRCIGVECPREGDDPDRTQCLAGACVPPECSAEDSARCGEPMCAGDADCAASTIACVRSRCIGQVCLAAAADGDCAAGEYCSPVDGCRPLPIEDGGTAVDGGTALDGGPGCLEAVPCDAGARCARARIDCTGGSPICVIRDMEPAGVPCRTAVGMCDRPESCTGTDPDCPPDRFLDAGTVCRTSTGACDPVETCSGSSATCPADVASGECRVEAEDGRVSRTAGWEINGWTGTSGGQIVASSMSTSPGSDTVTYAFDGPRLVIGFTTGDLMGIVAVRIDGAPYPDIDLYRAGGSTFVQQAFVVGTSFGPGAHTVQLTYTGRKNPASFGIVIHLDFFETCAAAC